MQGRIVGFGVALALAVAGCGGGGGGGGDVGVDLGGPPMDGAMDAGADAGGDAGGVVSDWFEVTDPHMGGTPYAGITSAVTAPQGGGIEITYPIPGAQGHFYVYVRPDSGTYDFGRAHAIAGYRDTLYLGGLTPGVRYCATVHFVGGGIEEGNTAEQCAVAAATPTPTLPTMGPVPFVRWTDTLLTLTADARVGAGLRYDLERSIEGGPYEVVASRTYYLAAAPLDATISFDDVPEVAGTYVYRLRTFADGVDVGVSNALTVPVITKPWRRAFDPYPQTLAVAMTPRLAVQVDGRLAVAELVSGASVDALLASPTLGSQRRGPDVTGDATTWKRLYCGIDDGRYIGTGSLALHAYAKAADGAVYVVVAGFGTQASTRLYRIGATGCAELVTTSVIGGATHLVAHPTDPNVLALTNGRGAWVSSDRGASFRLFVGGTPRAVAYAPDGTLYFADQYTLVRSTDGETFRIYGSWPDPNDPPRELAISSSGAMAAVGSGGFTITPGVYVGSAGGPLTFENLGLADHSREALLYLSDGRLLALLHQPQLPSANEEVRLAVRAATGGWSHVELPGPWKISVPYAPVLFDLRVGHEGDVYSNYHRSRDGGETWSLIPTGRAVTATTSASTFALITQTSTGMLRSLDGGDSGVSVPYGAPADGRVFWNPAAPLLGVSASGVRTTDGGSTWPSTSGGLDWSGVGFVSATEAYGATGASATTARRSTDSGAVWTVSGASNVRMACGNGTTALLTYNASGMFGVQVMTSAGAGGTLLGLSNGRACGLSQDGQTVYLAHDGGMHVSTTGPLGTYSRLEGAPIASSGALTVSPDGQRVSWAGWWSESGGR